MKKKILVGYLISVFLVSLAATARAANITSYDIDNAVKSGFGNWAHTYDGAMTTGASITVYGFPGVLSDYSGGSGTLNDNNYGTSNTNTQLFATGYNPVIDLYLDQDYFIHSIILWSFSGDNVIPGNITGVDVTIDGVTETFATSTLIGDTNEFINVDLSLSGLNLIPTDFLSLSAFTTTGTNNEFFSIAEISFGGATPIPEPATMLLLGTGLVGVAGAVRRKKKNQT